MHLLIPFAAPLSEAGRAAARSLRLPRLQALLGRLVAGARDEGQELSLSPPHERALAAALGWQGAAGCLPWAARLAQADGIATGDLAWGLLTPAHWHVGTDQVSLADPDELALDDAGSRELFEAVQGLFTSEGYGLQYGAPLRWYAAHESLAALPCASLDRVIGRNVDAWLGSDPAARRIRRLQSEVQMVLYTHAANDRRQARGLLPVNSFWLSGCGLGQADAPASALPPQVDARLRRHALGEDWAAWVKAWETLDEGPIAAALAAAEGGAAVRLTLCGERSAATFESAKQGLLQRLRAAFIRPALPALLEAL
ncbi:conserved hypothetical protein [Rubrivivax sp. A210]|uniref:hypothetical protein n=1 Tax=Rubrivivax sp. A210 TaxID=2772301 RepID=UPI001919F52A|nr:hypothetical protein [Rubrivivax sp. A210]CAD5374836.1 conserved hypothetical protein [Rubrivivax sp. A210]